MNKRQHQRYQPYPWRLQEASNMPYLFGNNFSSDVICDNFENHPTYQAGFFLGQHQLLYPSVNNYNAPVQTGSSVNSSHREKEKHGQKHKNKKKPGLVSTKRNVHPGQSRKEPRTSRSRDNEERSFTPYGNLSDFCMKLSKNNLEGNFWIDKITKHTSLIDKQISLFLLGIEADKKFYEKADELCLKLKEIFQPEFQGFEFTPKLFGSSKTTLALKDSDFDIYLDFGEGAKPNNLQNRIAKVIRMYKRHFSFHVITPIRARVPIVQCKSFAEPCCDISFTKSLGVYNSSLIRFLISLDERIRPVILILKFWLKKNNLLHFSIISSYGLANLVIFYLQQGTNPILPSVHFLQQKSPNMEFVDGWNVSFTQDKILIPTCNNNMSILELIRGFFNFYTVFDFESNVVCTYLGKALSKSQFSVVSKLPPELDLYKNYLTGNDNSGFMAKNPIWLQDPLIHNFNIARNANSVREFKKKCSQAANVVNIEWERSKRENYKCVLFKELFKKMDNNFIPGNKKKKGHFINKGGKK